MQSKYARMYMCVCVCVYKGKTQEKLGRIVVLPYKTEWSQSPVVLAVGVLEIYLLFIQYLYICISLTYIKNYLKDIKQTNLYAYPKKSIQEIFLTKKKKKNDMVMPPKIFFVFKLVEIK